MDCRYHRAWKLIGVTAVVIGGFALCRTTPGCFLSAAPPTKQLAMTQPFGEKAMFATKVRNTIEHVNEGNFKQTVLTSVIPVLVDFYADWCGPCKALAPVLEELARETPNAKIVKVNVDHSPELAARYGINAIPSLLIFKNGEIAFQHAGLTNKRQLESLLSR
jgi:thioredoxin 1